MKLVTAKCPNCGVNIEVDADSDNTKCNYCKSPVVVKDAIEQFDNESRRMSKVDSLLEKANTNYNDKAYEEAYSNYFKVLEIEPNNVEALLRMGFCKFFDADYSDANINIISKSFNSVKKLIINSNLDELDVYLDEAFDIVNKYEKLVFKFLDKEFISLNEIKIQIKKLVSCLEVYDYLYSIANNKEQKIKIANNIINICNDFSKVKSFDTNKGKKEYNGYDFFVRDLRNKYYKILNGNDNVKPIIERKVELENKNEFYNKLMNYVIYGLGVFLIILSFIMYLSKVYLLTDCIISWLFGIGIVIINLPMVSNNLFKSYKLKYILVLILFIIWLVFLFSKYIKI